LLGEGTGAVTEARDDVGNEDDEDAGPDGGAVAVETGVEDEAVAMGGLGVTERLPERLPVGGLIDPLGDDGGLVAAPEADEPPGTDEAPEAEEELDPSIVNGGLMFPESPNSTTI